MTSARVLELDEITAGIALPDGSAMRFFASDRRFDALERMSFRSLEQVYAAARRLITRLPHRRLRTTA